MDRNPDYNLASERADMEALVEMVSALKDRWKKRLSAEAGALLWQHDKFAPTPWPAVVARYPHEIPVRTADALHAALVALLNACDFLAEPSPPPNLCLARHRDEPGQDH